MIPILLVGKDSTAHAFRFCTERNLATREIKMVAAMVRRNFTVAREETGMPTREVFLFTKMPENLKVSFKKDNPTLIVNEGIEPLSPV